MISRKVSCPHMDGARSKASNGLAMLKLSLAFLIKVDKSCLDGLLRISGKHGVFIEHLAQNRPRDVIEWIPQGHEEDDMT